MPLSGAAMISENTAAAVVSRFAGSLSAASSGVSANVVATVVAIINFIVYTVFPAMTLSVQPRVGSSRCLPSTSRIVLTESAARTASPVSIV